MIYYRNDVLVQVLTVPQELSLKVLSLMITTFVADCSLLVSSPRVSLRHTYASARECKCLSDKADVETVG